MLFEGICQQFWESCQNEGVKRCKIWRRSRRSRRSRSQPGGDRLRRAFVWEFLGKVPVAAVAAGSSR